jgi:class 3 adenylate cyclase
MPLFMDVHDGLGDATPEDIAAAHARDLEHQDAYGVRFLTYWYNGSEGKTFCLVEAPDADTAQAVHKVAHGLMPHDIIEVGASRLNEFLGGYYLGDGDRAMFADTRQADPGLRAILFTDIAGSTDISTRLGDEAALRLLRAHDEIVREALGVFGGREVKHTGDGILACFASVTRAVQATMAMQQQATEVEALGLKVGLSVGEPVEQSDDIFGASVNLAARICDHAGSGQILTSGAVRDLAIGKTIPFAERGMIALKGFPEPVRLYEVGWSD